MTDFEREIKRGEECGITCEKFKEIRDDHKYGKAYNDKNGNSFFNYTYGDVSSWLTWNRDETGKIASIKPPTPDYTKQGRIYDGHIADWNEDLASRLTTDIVFVGLNLSGDGTSPFHHAFQNSRGERRIFKTFCNTQAEGGYFTDIIKPDKRILDEINEMKVKPSNSTEFMRVVRSFKKTMRKDIIQDHIKLFKEELDFIGAKKPLLIVFGYEAFKVIKEDGIKTYELLSEDDFHAIVQIQHPSGQNTHFTDEEYINDCSSRLANYLTIPQVIVPPKEDRKTNTRKKNNQKQHKDKTKNEKTNLPTIQLADDEIKKVIITGLRQAGISEIHDAEKSGFGYTIGRMEKYLPNNGKQLYRYLVKIRILRNEYVLSWCLTLYPKNQKDDVIKKINKILRFFNIDPVDNTRGYIDVFFFDDDLSDITKENIANSVKITVEKARKLTNECIDNIK